MQPSPPTPLPEYRERGVMQPSPPTPLPEYRERGVMQPSPPTPLPRGERGEVRRAFRWSLKVDRIGMLDALEPEDWAAGR